MLGIEKYISKDGSKFYLDISEWNENNDIQLDNGDLIKFSHEGKKYTAKVANSGHSNFGILELSILKEL
jgi:hypothetical protein